MPENEVLAKLTIMNCELKAGDVTPRGIVTCGPVPSRRRGWWVEVEIDGREMDVELEALVTVLRRVSRPA